MALLLRAEVYSKGGEGMKMSNTQSGRIVGRAQLPDEHGFVKMIQGIEEKYSGIHFDAVAALGSVGDWAVYVHFRDCSDEAIYTNGLKMHVDDAAPLFPYLDAGNYRP